MISSTALAARVVAGIDSEAFLIIPHRQVLEYFLRKAQGDDRWPGGMRKLAARPSVRPAL